jgi:hypothetical protein
VKLYGSNELTYNGSIIFNQDNLTKLSQLENDIKVEGPNGPDTLQMVINLHMAKILELDEAIKKANSLTQLLEDRLATLEEYEDNRILFDE